MRVSHIHMMQKHLEKHRKIQAILSSNGLVYTDLLVLNYLSTLGDSSFVKVSDVVNALQMDRGWIYKSIKRLNEKEFISHFDSVIALSAYGLFRLNRIFSSANVSFTQTNYS